MALNGVQPFASEAFARRVGLLVLEDRYPRDFFVADGEGVVVDAGDAWLVTFRNLLVRKDAGAVPLGSALMLPVSLTFRVRKCDGGVVDIS